MTNTIDFKALAEPFTGREVKKLTKQWKDKKTGKEKQYSISYITARTVMNRLDTVVGPANWYTKFLSIPASKNVECTLFLRVDGEWIGKSDIGTPSDIEPDKGAVSDALKRAAVHWGIGRELYQEGTADLSAHDDNPSPLPDTKGQYDPRDDGYRDPEPSELDEHFGPRVQHDRERATTADAPEERDPVRETGQGGNETKLNGNTWPKLKDRLIEAGMADDSFHAFGRLKKIAGVPSDEDKPWPAINAHGWTHGDVWALFEQRIDEKEQSA